MHVIPRIQSRAPGELAEMECHVTGVPVPNVKWLKNDENLKMLADKYTIVGNGTALMVSKITYSDTGAYMCVASSPAGSSRDISSLVVQDEPAPSECPQPGIHLAIRNSQAPGSAMETFRGISKYSPRSPAANSDSVIRDSETIPKMRNESLRYGSFDVIGFETET